MPPESGDQLEPALAVQYREATEHDADANGALHADSWRRYYRGAYLDSYLDGDILSVRQLGCSNEWRPPNKA